MSVAEAYSAIDDALKTIGFDRGQLLAYCAAVVNELRAKLPGVHIECFYREGPRAGREIVTRVVVGERAEVVVALSR